MTRLTKTIGIRACFVGSLTTMIVIGILRSYLTSVILRQIEKVELSQFAKYKQRQNMNDDLYDYLIQPPSNLPYRLSNPKIRDQSQGQCKAIDAFFKNKTNGFFIESGAHDGEFLSNTLYFERFRNWTGLLVEPNHSLFMKLMGLNRKAFAINACLSNKIYPSVESFDTGEIAYSGHVVGKEANISINRIIYVKCYPLLSILQAINRLDIDYFSLDVEGAEKGILETLPWEKINIKVFSIEYNKWPGKMPALRMFMEKRGYKLLSEMKHAPDMIFFKDVE